MIVCDECESLWNDDDIVSENNATDMSTYLESQGLKKHWKELDCEEEPLSEG